LTFYTKTSKKEWSEIAFNLAMQISEDNERKAVSRMYSERKLIRGYK